MIHLSADPTTAFLQGVFIIPIGLLILAFIVRQVKMWKRWYARRTGPQKLGMALMILGAKQCRAPFVKYVEFNGRRWISFDTPEFKLPDPGEARTEGLDWLTKP